MDGSGDFMQFMRMAKELGAGNRPLRLRLAYADGLNDDIVLPQQVDGSETVCGGMQYTICCVSLDAHLPLKQFIGVAAELLIVTDEGRLRSVCGIIAQASAGQSDGGLAAYRLVMHDALALMEKRRNTRVFRSKNELDIVELLIAEWRLGNPVISAAFACEVDQALAGRHFPARELTMQHNESDAAFIRRLLARRGIAWVIRPGRRPPGATRTAPGDTPAHTLFLFDDARRLPDNTAPVIRYHRAGATEHSDTFTAWGAVRTLQAGSIGLHSWDDAAPRNRPFMQMALSGAADQGPNGNRWAASVDDYFVATPHLGDGSDDFRQLGLLAMARHDLDTKCFHAEGVVRALAAGQHFSLAGHPEIDRHRPEERRFFVTALEVHATNNLPLQLDALVARLFAASGWATQEAGRADGQAQPGMPRYRMRCTCMRSGVALVPAFDPQRDVPQPQLQSAIVVGPAGEEVHCDGQGRIKVRFPATRAADHAHAQGSGASDTERDTAWLRVVSNWAGDGQGSAHQCGALSLPRVGAEVLIGFLAGDPDRPIVLGQLFNAVAPPPALSKRGALPGNRYQSGLRSREVRGQRGNQLRMDDTPAQISAQLASDHAATELNLGFLVEPRAGGAAAQRGDGFELRSDSGGAIRSGKALLLSAWKRLDAAGGQLSANEHLALMQECLDLFKSLGEYGAAHQALPLDASPAAALKDDVATAAAPTASLTAPAGLALSSPKTIVSYAGVNVDTVAQQHVQLSAGQHCSIHAGKGISVFAHQGGIAQIAHHGKFLMQSQFDEMQLNAAKALKMTANTSLIGIAQDDITFMTAGGAYLKLSGGKVELGGPGALTIRTDGHHWNGPASATAELPGFGEAELGRVPQAVSILDGSPVKGVKIVIDREDGTRQVFDADGEGKAEAIVGDTLEKLKVRIFRPRD
ncbi:type VI secretion system Vgr family protein [Janthinobacterium sp. PC23-8]|uniref:type VI secretion system Vgr family protein n=1 Tax=Janthinobacterium sp. PC23-8 TaxID=2012679 RepID=UPI000B9699C5|nr:type VI secretion system Vgr family protein [Janthinobacterium sp. PC23-8]OYO29870.1 type VI secretion protein [Janthinobacterium sp. PC23-8]